MDINKKSKPRLQFIESLLYWEGKVHRNDLINKLGVSAPQASLDLKDYREAAPENITYDPGTRNYMPTKNFSPKFYEPNAYSYLGDLMRYGEKLVENFNPAFGTAPNNTSVTILIDSVEADVVRDVILAIKKQGKLKIKYQGMAQQAKVTNRWIVPRIIFFDGMRWQTRAFCFLRNDYRTFTLSRILEIERTEFANYDIPFDEKWEEKIDVILAPNPEKTPEQQEVICKIYSFDHNRKRNIPVRIELLPYFLLANRLYPFSKDGNIVIENQTEIENLKITSLLEHLFN